MTLTAPQTRLLAKIIGTAALAPLVWFYRYEDPSSNAPATELRNELNETMFTFGKGEARAFDGLLRAGRVTHQGANAYAAKAVAK